MIVTMEIRWPVLPCVVKTVEGDFRFTRLPHATLTPRYSHGPYELNLYYPLPRKSGSIILVSLLIYVQPVEFRSKGMHGHRTSSCRKQGHINLPERNLHFTQKFNAKICRKKFTSQNWKQTILPQNLDTKYTPKISRH